MLLLTKEGLLVKESAIECIEERSEGLDNTQESTFKVWTQSGRNHTLVKKFDATMPTGYEANYRAFIEGIRENEQ
jgi:hypothetical protein